MKITPKSNLLPPNQNPPPPPAPSKPDLRRKQSRRKTAVSAVRAPRFQLRKEATPALSGKRAGPPTPLLRWKFDEACNGKGERDSVDNVAGAAGDRLAAEMEEFGGRRMRRGAKGVGGTVSVRKLAAALWRLQPPEVGAGNVVVGQERRRSRKEDDRVGFKQGTSHVGEQMSNLNGIRGFGIEIEPKGQPKSPCSVNGPLNGSICEKQASFKFSNYAMEGATKWDPICHKKQNDEKQNDAPIISALQVELEQAQRRIEELESERRSSKKKLKQFLHKLSEERSAWRSREHEKVCAIISDVKADLTRERKNCHRLEISNSKLVNELAEAKSVMKRYMQDFEKERKNRELMEEVCDELAKEMEEDKAEVEELKAECMKMREEVDDERKMLQMAEVWREERVQMKLVDAKVALEDKYSQMNNLVDYLQHFLKSKHGEMDHRDIKEAELLHQASSSVKIQDLEEFTYEPPKSDDIFSIFQEMGMGEMEQCDAYSRGSHGSKMQNTGSDPNGDQIYRLSNAYGSQNDDLEDDGSGWETVSHASGSVTSLNKAVHRGSNVSGSGTEWEGNKGDETPMTDTSEVCSVQSKHLKKTSSISRLWRSLPNNGDSYKIMSVDSTNGRLSNGGSLHGHWSSPDSGNPHIGKGMKGCIEWPRGQKHSLKSKLLEARVDTQKIQLRQVLKQKI